MNEAETRAEHIDPALKAAGWTIEGTTPGPDAVVQAVYLQKGRDLRATLRNLRITQSLAITDVGAQLPKPKPEEVKK